MNEKVVDLYKLLAAFRNFLISIGSSSENVQIIDNLSSRLKNIQGSDLHEFFEFIDTYKRVRNHIAPAIKRRKIDFKEIDSIYKKIQDNLPLTQEEETLIELFEHKYHPIRTFLFLDYKALYEKVSRAGEVDLSINMIKFLLIHYFGVESKSKKKPDLVNDLKKNIYSADYMDTMAVTNGKNVGQNADTSEEPSANRK